MKYQVLFDSFHDTVDDPFVDGIMWIYEPIAQRLSLGSSSQYTHERAQAQSRLDWARTVGGTSDAGYWQYLLSNSGNYYHTNRHGPIEIDAVDVPEATIRAEQLLTNHPVEA